MKFLNLTLLIALLGITTACTRHDCVRQFKQNARVAVNRAGERTVSFCKGGRLSGSEEVKVDQSGWLSFTTAYTRDRKSRYDGSCADYYAERDFQEDIPIALTSKNFAEVKLCYTNSEKTKIVLLEKQETCPEGTQEQLAPVDDCSLLK